MATGNKLEVGIGADISELKAGITEAVIALEKLRQQKSANLKVGIDVSALNTQIASAKEKLASLQKQASSTAPAMDKLGKSTANGSNALMQFSRIAQDAPYGIIGIGNNITATTEAFGYLKQQTGSTGGALKALASSLMGSGGVLLAVSLLTTGLTLLSQSGLSVGDVIDKITGNFDEFGGAIKKASEEGAKAAGKEVESLRELVAIAQNDNIAKKDRLIAVEKLQTQFSAYYGNLSAEKIMYSDLTKETNAATNAILAKAVAEKLGAKAGDKFIERLNAQQKFNDTKKALDALEKKQEKELFNLKNASASQVAIIQAKQLNARQNLLDQAEEERQAVISLVKEYDKFGKVIDKLNEVGAPLDRKATKPKTTKTFDTPQVSGASSLIPIDLVVSPINTTPIATAFTGIREVVGQEMIATMELLYNFNNDVNDLVTGSLTSTFDTLGASIGEALSTGGNVFQAIGNSLLASLGSFISDMGGLLIKYGVLAVAKGQLDIAIATGGPIAVGAGIAAIAVGIALKAVGGAISAKAKGGQKNTSSSTGSNANNSSSTSTSGYSGGSGYGTVVFEIAGTSLIGVLNNTTDRNLRIGGRT